MTDRRRANLSDSDTQKADTSPAAKPTFLDENLQEQDFLDRQSDPYDKEEIAWSSDAAKDSSSETERPIRGRLRDGSIEEKVGNYIFTVGYPGSGKTVFQSFLTYYINHSPDFRSQPVLDPEDVQGWAAQATYNDWITRWHRGEFPNPNAFIEDDIQELSFIVNPKRGVTSPLRFSFLEVAGEFLRQVIADEHQDPTLVETLRRYLENSRLQFLLVLVIDPARDDDRENDLLFQNFFTFLDVNCPDIYSRSSLALLISKPNEALGKLKNAKPGLRHHAELRGELCEDYIETFLPATYNRLDTWIPQERATVMSLNIGEIDDARETPRIVKPDMRDISKIFSWIYSNFTKEKLGPKWWQRIIAWIRE